MINRYIWALFLVALLAQIANTRPKADILWPKDTNAIFSSNKNAFSFEGLESYIENTLNTLYTDPQTATKVALNKDNIDTDDTEWSVLDDLPECGNRTAGNATLCVIKDRDELNESVTTQSQTTTGPSNKDEFRSERRTRELPPRKRRKAKKPQKKPKKKPQKKKPSKKPQKKPPKKPKKKKGGFLAHLYTKAVKKDKQLKRRKEQKRKKLGKKIPKKPLVKLGGPGDFGGNAAQRREQIIRHANYKRIYKQFDDYHKCTKNKVIWYQKPWEDISLYYKIATQTVQLPCDVCQRPDETVDDYKLTWARRATEKTEIEKLNVLSSDDPMKDRDDDSRFSWGPDGALIITDLRMDDTGQYMCIKGGQYETVHMLEVTPKEPTIQVVGKMMYRSRKGDLPRENETLVEENLEIFTKWSSWTPCSRCDVRGIKKRIGICSIKKRKPDLPVQPNDAKIFGFFPEGIPCHSTLLPNYIQKIEQILYRKSEVQTNYCFVECSAPPKKKVVRDKKGKLVEVISSQKGYRAVKVSAAKFPPLVRRKTSYVEEGQKTVVTCVKKIKPMSIVRWQKDHKILDPIELPKITDKRMHISPTNKLFISDVQLTDKAIYSCWVDGKLRKTTKVKVYGRRSKNAQNKIVYVGVVVSVIVIIAIVTNIGKNRKKGRQ